MISHDIGIEDVIANATVTPIGIDNVENANHTLIMIVSNVIDIIHSGQIFSTRLNKCLLMQHI
jgi:hypothetical protein